VEHLDIIVHLDNFGRMDSISIQLYRYFWD